MLKLFLRETFNDKVMQLKKCTLKINFLLRIMLQTESLNISHLYILYIPTLKILREPSSQLWWYSFLIRISFHKNRIPYNKNQIYYKNNSLAQTILMRA